MLTDRLLVAVLVLDFATAFRFVYMPCDQSLPMEEWQLHPRKDDEIGPKPRRPFAPE